LKESSRALLLDKIAAFGMGDFYSAVENEIRGRNGSIFWFAGLRSHATGTSSTADALKSKEGIDIAWVEEAQTISQPSLDLLIPTVRRPNSEIWFTWNPRSARDPVDAMFRGPSPPDDAIIVHVNWYENPFFADTPLLKHAEEVNKRDPDKYRHVYLGEYMELSETRVFRNWVAQDFTTPDNIDRFYFGADWGFSRDPSVLVRSFIHEGKLYIDHEAYAVGCKIDTAECLILPQSS
jgi:phage terminase large subunit